MSTWEDKIGDFKTLTQKGVFDKFGNATLLYILAARAVKHAELVAFDDEYETYDKTDVESVPKDPYFRFETFDMALAPKKKVVKKKPAAKKPVAKKPAAKGKGKSKKVEEEEEEEPVEEEEEAEENAEPAFYTYEAAERKPVKDPKNPKVSKKGADGKVLYETVVGEHKVKKFATISTDLKKYITYLFNKYLKEAHACYEDQKFAKTTPVLEQTSAYVTKHYDNDGITPFIIAVGNLLPVDNFVDESAIKGSDLAFDLSEFLITRAQKFFKDKKGHSPNSEIGEIVEAFVTFLKVVCVMYLHGIWGKSPGAMHIPAFEGVIRQLYVLLNADEKGGFTFQYEIYTAANDWVAESEAAKVEKAKSDAKGGKGRKKKTEDDEDADANDEDADDALAEVEDEGEADADADDGEAGADEVDLEE